MANAPHDPHQHRTLNVPDVPLDAANQSLADALRASFGVLKAIMIVLVVLFLFSGLKCVDEHQKAVVLRFGEIQAGAVRNPGLSWALPYPVDETLRVGVTAETLKFMNIHMPRGEDRFGGLNPGRDGALLTGDRGLAHAQWVIVYRVDDLPAFVRNVSDANDAKTRELIETLLRQAAVDAAARFTAEEISQTRTDELARQVKAKMNEALASLGTGVSVTSVDLPSAAVPYQTRDAFLAVSAAENARKTTIQEAQQRANKLLNETAGGAHLTLAALFRDLDAARAAEDTARVDHIEQEVERVLVEEATGDAGAQIRAADAEYTETVQGLRGDVEQFQLLLAEYQRTPRLLIDRLWEQTRKRIMGYPDVTKYYLPPGATEVRIKVYPDAEQRRQAEIEALKHESALPGGKTGEDFEVQVPGNGE